MTDEGYTEVNGLHCERLPSGGVRLTDPDAYLTPEDYDFTEDQWTALIAAMSKTGQTELTLNAASLLHRGLLEVKVDVYGEAVARIALRQATGREQKIQPEIVQAKKPPLKPERAQENLAPVNDLFIRASQERQADEQEAEFLKTLASRCKLLRHELMDGPDAFDKDSAEYFAAKYVDSILENGSDANKGNSPDENDE